VTISVVVPAHNEERYLGACLLAARAAAERVSVPVELVVVLNRCDDGTAAVAEEHGALTVVDESRCIASIRNRGVAASSGEVVVTCDADSRMHPGMLTSVLQKLEEGAVGGGTDVRFDRRSLGIRMTELFLRVMVGLTRVSCAAFWTTREAFDAVGGFDERLPMGEDVDFGRRLRRLGKGRGAPYGTLWSTPLMTSARKFDHYGDWSFFRMLVLDAGRIRRSMKGRDTEFVDEYFYDFNERDRLASRKDAAGRDDAGS
jgi:glycosyltransferase involved in cell wall biosynthesis